MLADKPASLKLKLGRYLFGQQFSKEKLLRFTWIRFSIIFLLHIYQIVTIIFYKKSKKMQSKHEKVPNVLFRLLPPIKCHHLTIISLPIPAIISRIRARSGSRPGLLTGLIACHLTWKDIVPNLLFQTSKKRKKKSMTRNYGRNQQWIIERVNRKATSNCSM